MSSMPAHSDSVEASAQIEEYLRMTTWSRLTSQQTSDDTPRVAIERQPAIFVWLQIEEVQHAREFSTSGSCSAKVSGNQWLDGFGLQKLVTSDNDPPNSDSDLRF